MSWIVATGVNGFIGTHVVESILALDPSYKVLGSDLPRSLERPTARRYEAEPRYRFVLQEDLLHAIDALDSPPLAIIHNGACSSTLERDPEVFRVLNVESSQQLWKLCADQGVPYLYASSASVYGDGALGFDDTKARCSEYEPLNLYGHSKHQFDLWALQQKQRPPVWLGMRYFNVFGPFEEHKGNQASMVLRGYEQIVERGWVGLFKSNDPRYQDGEQLRDFVYVRDVCAVTMALLQRSLKGELTLDGNGCFVNIGRGQTVTWLRLIRALFLALGKKPDIRFIDMPAALADQYQNYTCAELGTLRDVLGVNYRFTEIEEAVADYVASHLSTRAETAR